MLFNSPEFIFGFVPLTLLGFFLMARLRHVLNRGRAESRAPRGTLICTFSPIGSASRPSAIAGFKAGKTRLGSVSQRLMRAKVLGSSRLKYSPACFLDSMCHLDESHQAEYSRLFGHAARMREGLKPASILK